MTLLRRHRVGGLDPWVVSLFGGGAPVIFDYTAGGLIPGVNCIQAFDPFALQDLAASYIDLTGNGNDALVTVPPTIAVGGWVFDGLTQYLGTGIIPTKPCTMIVQFVGVSIPLSHKVVCGANDYTTYGFFNIITPRTVSVRPRGVQFSDAYKYGANSELAGNAALSTKTSTTWTNPAFTDGRQFWNGVKEGLDFNLTPIVTTIPIMIATLSPTGAAGTCLAVTIKRYAYYNIELSEAQVAALAAVMATD